MNRYRIEFNVVMNSPSRWIVMEGSVCLKGFWYFDDAVAHINALNVAS